MSPKENWNMQGVSKFFVGEDGFATIICPDCGFVRKINGAKLTNQINARCKCGAVFKCIIEYRKTFRKNINLPGKLWHYKKRKLINIRLKDISMKGVGFELKDNLKISPGDFMEIHFFLDDLNQSEIRRKLTVKRCNGNFVGCAFIEHEAYEKVLGFYLMR